MIAKNNDKEIPQTTSPQSTPSFLEKHSTVFYVILSLLLVMRKRLGMEAMLEYMAEYTQGIEKHNPDLQAAVEEALQQINVEKLYREATKKT